MATYTVKAPDGKTITLQGPDGASQEDIIAQAQKLYTPQTAAAQPQQSIGSKVLNFLGNLTGEKNLGTFLGSELSRLTPEGRALQQSVKNPFTNKVSQTLQQKNQASNQAAAKQVFTGGVTPKQAAGSALMTAGDILLAGAGGAGGEAGAGEQSLLQRLGANTLKNAPAATALSVGQDIQNNRSLPKTIEDIPLNALTFGALDTALGGLGQYGKALEESAKTKSLSRAITGSENVTKADLFKTGANKQLVKTLVGYGADTIGKMKNMADALTGRDFATGKTGALTALVDEALNKANPVDMTPVKNLTRDITGARQGITKSRASVTSGLSSADKELYDMVNKSFFGRGAESIYQTGKSDLNEALTTNNGKAFRLLQDLQTTASQYAQSFTRTGSADARIAAKNFSQVANLLEHQLFENSGANSTLVKDILTPERINSIKNISPKLGTEVENIANNGGTVSELRSIQRPFVQAGKITNMLAKRADQLVPLNPSSEVEAFKNLMGMVTKPISFASQKVVRSALAGEKVAGKLAGSTDSDLLNYISKLLATKKVNN